MAGILLKTTDKILFKLFIDSFGHLTKFLEFDSVLDKNKDKHN